ncbi:hypothetical protein IPA_08605 [Ignicoccus pacificus DSM 13166]|uniref:Chorismate mutase n=1 Tax=Ignicoccus pacificus DSM 13166 TaxID=940294 RepID=A0A977KD03_9CREN|nr:hypothetical protein IPA_08605 [Ignicoccus pacificus DSM 13166]
MTQGVPEELRIKRKELDKVDRELLSLIAKRMKIVKDITEIKRKYGIPVFDKAREEQVLKTREIWGLEEGIDWRFVEEVFKLILQQSRSQQLYAKSKLYIGIYGYGGMARTLAEVFSRAGHKVVITGRNLEKAKELAQSLKVEWGEPKEVASKVEWLILAVPPDALIDVVRELAPLMRSGSLLSDISSVKSGIVDKILKELPEYVEYISLHPLFGPDIDPIGETIVMIPLKSYDYWVRELSQALVSMGFEVVTASPDEHDKAMAVTQVLHHFALLTLKRSMDELAKELDVNYEGYVTYSFKKTLDTIKRLESLFDVVKEIQQRNPYAKNARRKFIENAEQLNEEFA